MQIESNEQNSVRIVVYIGSNELWQSITISWSLSHINMRTYGCLQKDKGSYLNILQAKMDIAEKEDTANQHKPT